jgi:predicted MFS family arabinose efflux permease
LTEALYYELRAFSIRLKLVEPGGARTKFSHVWASHPAAQLARLIGIAGPGLAPVVLSLNASFVNFGLSLGAVLGSFTLAKGSAAGLGWVGAVCELAAVALMPISLRWQRAADTSACAGKRTLGH